MRFLRLLLLQLIALLARPCVRPAPTELRRVLYIKPDHLGDLLLATPVLAHLRKNMPDAQLTALVGPWAQSVLERNPNVDVLLTCPFPGFERKAQGSGVGESKEQARRGDGETGRRSSAQRKLKNKQQTTNNQAGLRTTTDNGQRPMDKLRSSFLAPYITLLRYASLLRATRYDVAIIGRDDHWWGAALALLAGIPLRIGFAVPECRPLLSDALPWNPNEHVTNQGLALVEHFSNYLSLQATESRTENREPRTENRFLVLQYGSSMMRSAIEGVTGNRVATSGLGAKGAGVRKARKQISNRHIPHPASRAPHPASFTPAPADIDWAENWCATQLAAGERLIVIHPGTGGEAKHWFDERWAAVADTIAALPQTRIVLTGGPDEEARVSRVQANMRKKPLNLAGQTSFGQLAALMARATLVLGVDSGPLHLAAAVGAQTIHLYGPGNEQRFGPWGDPAKHTVLHTDLWCRPCGVFSACPRGLATPECMDRLSVHAVAQLSVEALKGGRQGPER